MLMGLQSVYIHQESVSFAVVVPFVVDIFVQDALIQCRLKSTIGLHWFTHLCSHLLKFILPKVVTCCVLAEIG